MRALKQIRKHKVQKNRLRNLKQLLLGIDEKPPVLSKKKVVVSGPTIQDFAHEMRENPTRAEKQILKTLTVMGIKFFHQYVIGKRILDFYLPEHFIAIEADGAQHFTKQGSLNDKKRALEIIKIEPRIRFIRLGNEFVVGNSKLKNELARKIKLLGGKDWDSHTEKPPRGRGGSNPRGGD